VPSSAPTSSAHLCPAVHPPVPLYSATHLCPATCAAHQCPPTSAQVSAVYQYPSSVSPISAASPCHLISTAYQCPLVLPISAAYQCPSVLPHQRTSVKEKKYLFKNVIIETKKLFFFFKFFALFLFI
ncbi:unnamed protein product, partial [Staurois parvus]